MASPAVVGTPAETAISTAGTSHVVNLPSGAAGNLFIAIMDKGSTSATVNSLTGWNELLDENAANGLYIAWKAVDGTEGATTTFTLSANTRGAWIVYELSGCADPAVTPPAIGTTATGTSATPDPPSVTPPSNKDYLFIAFAGMAGEEADDDTWGNTPPTNYTPSPPRQKSCGTAGTNLGGLILSAERALATGSAENPGTFGVDVSAAWRAQTIIVHPKTTTTSVAEVSLDSVNTPDVRTGHSIKIRASKASGSGTVVMKAALYEGANNRSTDLTSSALTTSLADYTLAIAEADAEDITDYSNLGIRFWAESTSGNDIAVTVAEIYLEVPAGAASQDFDITPATETDTAGTLRAPNLTTASETDTARPVTITKTIFKTVTLAAETDTAQAVDRDKKLGVTLAAETDSAQALDKDKARSITNAQETDTAGTLRAPNLGVASETDTARPATASKSRGVTQAGETDTAGTLRVPKLAPAAETDTAQNLTYSGPIRVSLAVASETDMAQAVTFTKVIYKTLGVASETDTAQPVVVILTKSLTPAGETDTASGLVAHKVVTLGHASETDSARVLLTGGETVIEPATETDVAMALRYGALPPSGTLGRVLSGRITYARQGRINRQKEGAVT